MLETILKYAKKAISVDSNTLNHLTVCKLMSSGSFKKHYLQTIR